MVRRMLIAIQTADSTNFVACNPNPHRRPLRSTIGQSAEATGQPRTYGANSRRMTFIDRDFASDEGGVMRPMNFLMPGRCLTRRLILTHQCAPHNADVDLAQRRRKSLL
jgi:hypothetical protein